MIHDTDGAILKKYDPLVRRIAHQYIAKLPANVELDDLIQEGRLGLLHAKQKYDEQFETTFETYATQRIRGAILDHLRGLDWASRRLRQQIKKIEQATALIENQKGRRASPSEVSTMLGMDINEFHRIITEATGSSLISLDDSDDDEDNPNSLTRTLVDHNMANPLDVYLEGELQRLVSDGVANLPERERFVITSVVQNELPLKEVGLTLGVTEARVSQLFAQAAQKIRKQIDIKMEGGILPSLQVGGKTTSRDREGSSPPTLMRFARFSLPSTFSILYTSGIRVPHDLARIMRANRDARNLDAAPLPIGSSVQPSYARFELPEEFQIVAAVRLELPQTLLLPLRPASQRVTDHGLQSEFRIVSTTALKIPSNLVDRLSLSNGSVNSDESNLASENPESPILISASTMSERNKNLLSKALKGDRDALAEYLMFLRPRVIKSAQSKGLKEAEAEDMFSISVMKVMDAISEKLETQSFKNESGLRNWIEVIFSNSTFDVHRGNSLYHKNFINIDGYNDGDGDGDTLDLLDFIPSLGSEGLRSPEDAANQKDLLRFLSRIMETADREGTKQLRIYFEYALSKDADPSFGAMTLAQKYGISEGTVKTHFMRARLWLEKHFGAEARAFGIV